MDRIKIGIPNFSRFLTQSPVTVGAELKGCPLTHGKQFKVTDVTGESCLQMLAVIEGYRTNLYHLLSHLGMAELTVFK